ncbi:hypothetical protein Hypma_008531 [Hypsizygus marmoreus]|uniref:XPG-I domain-containing protein n=1 Tax=Hypsizygus marmoreus TaxID=39966 RepID=A0A369K0J5_HYPMA|nr:hypothetical protein Hypma_008531 [Hypsizygus marmoreus]
MPVTLVFVLDGPHCPSVKRSCEVKPVPLWIASYLEELVDAFGFFVHQAPGEAEAELAKLNRLGMIDAIITDDSDTLVFGAIGQTSANITWNIISSFTTTTTTLRPSASIPLGIPNRELGDCYLIEHPEHPYGRPVGRDSSQSLRQTWAGCCLLVLDTRNYTSYRALHRSVTAKPDDFDSILLYAADSIEYLDGVQLTPGGLLLFALLTGGDYDSGIEGCGATIAQALAACGFGDELLDAALSRTRSEMMLYLEDWRRKLRLELQSNSRGYLKSRNPSVARKITDSFPNLAVLKQYLEPLTSWSSQPGCQIPNGAAWRICEPKIPRITAFCLQQFGWGKDRKIVRRFHAKLWEGIAFRMLCSVLSYLSIAMPYTDVLPQPLVVYDDACHLLASPMANATMKSQAKSRTAVASLTPSSCIIISTNNFQAQMGEPWSNLTCKGSIPLHVPNSVLQHAIPSLSQNKMVSRGNHKHSPTPIASRSSLDSNRRAPRQTMSSTSEVIELSDDEDRKLLGRDRKLKNVFSSEIIDLMESVDDLRHKGLQCSKVINPTDSESKGDIVIDLT